MEIPTNANSIERMHPYFLLQIQMLNVRRKIYFLWNIRAYQAWQSIRLRFYRNIGKGFCNGRKHEAIHRIIKVCCIIHVPKKQDTAFQRFGMNFLLDIFQKHSFSNQKQNISFIQFCKKIHQEGMIFLICKVRDTAQNDFIRKVIPSSQDFPLCSIKLICLCFDSIVQDNNAISRNPIPKQPISCGLAACPKICRNRTVNFLFVPLMHFRQGFRILRSMNGCRMGMNDDFWNISLHADFFSQHALPTTGMQMNYIISFIENPMELCRKLLRIILCVTRNIEKLRSRSLEFIFEIDVLADSRKIKMKLFLIDVPQQSQFKLRYSAL